VLTINVFVSGAGEVYAQTDGIAMGLGCAPILADLSLAYLEVNNPHVFQNFYCARYLDDVLILGEKEVVEKAIDQITLLFPLSLSFSVVGVRGAYLDTAISCMESSIETGVFFKPESNAVYVPFCSAHPFHQKTSWLKGELIRYVRICSTPRQFDVARTRFILAALARGYPETLLYRTIGKIRFADRAKFQVVRGKNPEFGIGFVTPSHKFRNRLPVDPLQCVREISLPPPSVLQVVNSAQRGLLHLPPLWRRLD